MPLVSCWQEKRVLGSAVPDSKLSELHVAVVLKLLPQPRSEVAICLPCQEMSF